MDEAAASEKAPGPEGVRRHGALLLLLAVQAATIGAIFASSSPWATTPLECHTGAISQLLRSGTGWSWLDLWHGAMSAYLLAGLQLVPLHAVLGEGPLAGALVAWAWMAAGVVVVYAVFARLDRRVALAAAFAAAFMPPVVFRAGLTTGDWHWTQMVFDWAAVLVALELCRRSSGGRWLVFGCVTGLAAANSLGSAPYLVVAWAIALWGARGRAVEVGGALVSAVALSFPAWWKLLIHPAYGGGGGPDKVGSRLTSLAPDPLKIGHFFSERFPPALHLDDPFPEAWRAAAEGGAHGWLLVGWLGIFVAATLGRGNAAEGLLGGLPWRRAPSPLFVPVLFVLVFCAAYAGLDVQIWSSPEAFDNVRQPTHRMLPPLLFALGVGGAATLAQLARLFDGVLAWFCGALAVVPGALGLLSTLAMIGPGGSVGDYRAACYEPMGFFAAEGLGDARAALRLCDSLGPAEAVDGCRQGAAWGVGFFDVADAHEAQESRAASGRLGLGPDGLAGCRELDPELRSACRLGAGWYVGVRNWQTGRWPLNACSVLADPEDRAGCWRGVGFPLGDHLAPTPWRIDLALQQAPAPHRADVARGLGFAIGRTWSSAERAAQICDELELATPCRRGVADAHGAR